MTHKITIGSTLEIPYLDQYLGLIDTAVDDNTFKNPAFSEAIKYKRSTKGIEPNIKTWHYNHNGDLVVPRGYLSNIDPKGERYEYNDQTHTSTTKIPALHGISLREYQKQAVLEAFNTNQGIIQAGTGSGKTIMGLALIHARQQRALILTHSRELMKQWQGEIKKIMGVDCGLIGNGKNTEADITIGMLQTLSKRPEQLQELSNNYGLVLVDECHHIPAKQFAKVINALACKYRYGLTATPKRRDGLHQLINRHIGNIIYQVTDEQVQAANGTVPMVVKPVYTSCIYSDIFNWNDYLRELTQDKQRNSIIMDTAVHAKRQAPTLILTDRVEHAERLSELADRAKIQHLIIHGKLSAKERTERMQAIARHNLTIGTAGLLGEGINISSWTNLILSMPISSETKLLQAIGRVCRPAEGKERAYIADFVDNCSFSESSFKKRLAIYCKKGVKIL